MQKYAPGFILLFVGSIIVSSVGLKAGSFDISGTTTGTQSLSASQSGTVEATGTLNVATGTAVTIKGTGASLINYGVIEETGTSRTIRDNTGGLTWTVTNSGTISSSGNDTIQTGTAGSTVTITNTGTIESLGTGTVLSSQAIDFNNNDTTTGTTTINNNGGGYIYAADSDAVRPGTNGVINNDGKILSQTIGDTGNDGIDAQSNTGVSITNAKNNLSTNLNLIEGARHGITGGNTGTLNNVVQTGTQVAGYVGTGSFSMTITNNSNGTIQGDDGSGINIDGFGISSGTLTATGTKLITNELVTVINSGTITGNGVTADGDGIDVDGAVNITNSGLILSKNATGTSGIEFSEGVTVGGGTITNNTGGMIEGQVSSTNTTTAVGRGITLAGVDKDGSANDNPIPIESIYTDSTITNSGLIRGFSESGIAVLGTTGGGYTVTINNNAGGTIEGSNTGTTENTTITTGPSTGSYTGQSLNQGAIELDDTGNSYVINNSGTITQDKLSGGVAISAHGVSNAVNVTGGSASIVGNIIGDAGKTNTLTVDPGAGHTFGYTYSTTNFGTELKSGTTQLSGTFSPSGTQTFKVDSGAELAPGGTQPAPGATSTANGNLTLSDSGLTPGSTLASFTGAKLTFALGTTGASQIDVTGSVANAFSFTSSTVSINDLALALVPGTEYVLIQGSDTTFNLQLSSPNLAGQELVTGGLTLASGNTFASSYGGSQLYYDPTNDSIDVQVGVGTVATPEPQTWVLILLGVGCYALILRWRRTVA
jgi:hypothetical protein